MLESMDKITISDLEVHVHIGVTEAERARPQRLLVTVEMESDLSVSAASDHLTDTIDYFAVSQRLLALGKDRRWNLIESLAAEVADLVLDEFGPRQVMVQVKKFVIPQAQYVSVSLVRSRPLSQGT